MIKFFNRINNFYLDATNFERLFKYLCIGGFFVTLLNYYTDYSIFGYDITVFLPRSLCLLMIIIGYIYVDKWGGQKVIDKATLLIFYGYVVCLFYLYMRSPIYLGSLNEVVIYLMVLPLSFYTSLLVIISLVIYMVFCGIYMEFNLETHYRDTYLNQISISISIIVVYLVVYSYRKSLEDKEAKLVQALDSYKNVSQSLLDTQAQLIHDVKSPLTALKYLSQDESQQNSLLLMATERVEKIIHDLQQEKINVDIENKYFNVEEALNIVIQEAKIRYSEVIREVTINIENNLNDNFLCLKDIDKHIFSRVISNLLNNSIEAKNNDNYVINIYLNNSTEKDLLFNMKDNGPGISDKDIKKILIKGYSTKGSERGLGLSYTNDMITKNGGSLDLLNNHGFQIRLKLKIDLL